MLLASAGICVAAESPAAKLKPSTKRLLITVVQTADVVVVRELLESDSDGGIPVRRWGTRHLRGLDNSVQVQALAGQPALVRLSQSVPDVQILGVEVGRGHWHRRPVPYVRLDSRVYSQGFYVQADLAGKSVVLKLHYYSDMPRADSSMSSTGQEIRTSVFGRVGQWLDAGGSLDLSRGDNESSVAGRNYSAWRGDRDATRLLIKVELAD